MVVLGQEEKLSGITKSYVTIGFILEIDKMFVEIFPDEVKKNAERLNNSGLLVMGEDRNTFHKLRNRFEDASTFKDYFNIFANTLINIWFIIISNF
jgi:hypothetical protein